MKYLPLTFLGVLQYYASPNSSSIKGTFPTEDHPTKSAVVGMIASALGYERGAVASRELYDKLDVKYEIIKEGSIFTDFQTVKPLKSQDNYMNKHHTNKFTTVSGALITKQGELKYVNYLQDAEFKVYIGADEQTLEEIYNAIRNPVYALYFGKRCCVPNKPIVGNYELVEDLDHVFDCA